ncbi:MAG: UDP-N-acetylmuramoyl-L-alanine--D-glutamate ligase [Firmicutes bacterium]|nr:UDP-N-acetylmuramoyl-L-alanine--D-glutamate ligase [Bacillota bacterium]
MNNNYDMADRKVLVVGLGKSGIAATEAMIKLGAKVAVQDSKKEEETDVKVLEFLKENKVELYLGKLPEDFSDFDMLILSPGVNPELEFVQRAEAQGAEIVGELEIAYRLAKGTFVALTGTNGKTTTTTLVGEIFKKSGRKTNVVGNIGVAVVSKALETTDEDWLITETSSFQLQTVKEFKPVVSAILNITPDHLNRHHTMEEYGQAKANIFANQTADDYAVVNGDDEFCVRLAKQGNAKVVMFSSTRELEKGAFLKDGKLVLVTEDGEVLHLCDKAELKILGKHNVENALAAAAICYYAGIEIAVISEALKEFAGVEHRIEFCGEVNGAKYYNDSKGTNVDAAVTALRALEKNVILIAGGDGKSQDFVPFIENFNGSVKHMVLLGRDAKLIAEACDKCGFKEYSFGKDMDECVEICHKLAVEGDNVLLSPACASWDMYKNFEQRGDHFKGIVKAL